MSRAPFDSRLVIERLRSQLPASFTVGGAADLGAVTSTRDYRPPHVFVVLVKEEPQARKAGHPGGAAEQLATVYFATLVVARNYRDPLGQAAATDLHESLGLVREALIGWVPVLPAARDCQLIEGQPSEFDASVLVWTDLYQTQHCLGGTA
jgi:hypothetical protein